MNKIRFLCGFFWGLFLGLAVLAVSVWYKPPLNPGKCNTNCMGCTIAYDLTQRGIECHARNFEPAALGVNSLMKAIYPDLVEQTVEADYTAIKNALLQGGGRGYIRYARKDQSRHMVAFFVRDGRVYVVDAQKHSFGIPLRVFLWLDKGVSYSWATLSDLSVSFNDLLNQVIERSEK